MTEKVNLKIEDFEDKKTKADRRYTRFKTSDGWMSAFGNDTIEKLKQNVGKMVWVEIACDEESGFKNLRKFIGLADGIVTPPKTENGSINVPVERPGETPAKYNGQTAMYVSYAKDIFCNILNTQFAREQKGTAGETEKAIMHKAIELIKQAKEAFN